eukprot:187299_1
MQSDRLGRLLQLKQQDESIQSISQISYLSFDEAGAQLKKLNEQSVLQPSGLKCHPIVANIMCVPDCIVMEYICRCLDINDIISLESTCLTFAIICRYPL